MSTPRTGSEHTAGRPRRRHSSEFTARVASEALKGEKPLNELASEFGVHPVQSAQWKRQLQDASADANDWRAFAQDKLDTTLAQHALLLDVAHADALRQYALTLGLEPHDLLLALLAPRVAQRERLRRQALAFVRAHAPRRPLGCLTPALWPVVIVGMFTIAHWLVSLLALVIPR